MNVGIGIAKYLVQRKKLNLGSDGRNPGNETASEIWNVYCTKMDLDTEDMLKKVGE